MENSGTCFANPTTEGSGAAERWCVQRYCLTKAPTLRPRATQQSHGATADSLPQGIPLSPSNWWDVGALSWNLKGDDAQDMQRKE
jgi:hypothetical protein